MSQEKSKIPTTFHAPPPGLIGFHLESDNRWTVGGAVVSIRVMGNRSAAISLRGTCGAVLNTNDGFVADIFGGEGLNGHTTLSQFLKTRLGVGHDLREVVAYIALNNHLMAMHQTEKAVIEIAKYYDQQEKSS